MKRNASGRAHLVQQEIDFALSKESDTHVLTDLLARGELPLRVTHNDTKLNNILFDRSTRKALCIIDLDTVMPGLSLYDFGDSIRTGASTGAEDEQDLSKIELDLNLYETFTKGFLAGCQGSLTNREIELLPMGAKASVFWRTIWTAMCTIRYTGKGITWTGRARSLNWSPIWSGNGTPCVPPQSVKRLDAIQSLPVPATGNRMEKEYL